MLKQTFEKAAALSAERIELEKKVNTLKEWTESLKEGQVKPPYYSSYKGGNTTMVQIDLPRFTLLVQVERAECQARLAQVMEEFFQLQDPPVSDVEFEEGRENE